MRLLIVGGGHASLPALADARRWTGAGVAVTLLNDRPELWYSGMTPEWLGAVYTRMDVTVDLAALCAREGVELVGGRAVRLDRENRRVETEDGRALSYDLAAFDVGGVNPGRDAAGPAVQTKPLHEIEALGAWLDETARAPAPRRLAVVGGGAAGVEVALNVTARPDLDGRLHVTVISPDRALLPAMPARARRWAAATLRGRGVDLRLGERADHVGDDALRLASGESVLADRVLWATGSVGPPWLSNAGLATDEAGFVRVDRGLRSLTDARVFVAGDAAVVEGHEELARIGVHAVKQGPTLRTNLDRALEALRDGRPLADAALAPFRPYPVAPLILSTGARFALLVAGPVALRGPLLLRLKHRVDRRWMATYATRTPSYRSTWDARSARDLPARQPEAAVGTA